MFIEVYWISLVPKESMDDMP